jgi:hypothetical protein
LRHEKERGLSVTHLSIQLIQVVELDRPAEEEDKISFLFSGYTKSTHWTAAPHEKRVMEQIVKMMHIPFSALYINGRRYYWNNVQHHEYLFFSSMSAIAQVQRWY